MKRLLFALAFLLLATPAARADIAPPPPPPPPPLVGEGYTPLVTNIAAVAALILAGVWAARRTRPVPQS